MPRIDKGPNEQPTGQEIQDLRNWLIAQGHAPNVAAQIAVAGVVLEQIAKKAQAVFRDLPKAE